MMIISLFIQGITKAKLSNKYPYYKNIKTSLSSLVDIFLIRTNILIMY